MLLKKIKKLARLKGKNDAIKKITKDVKSGKLIRKLKRKIGKRYSKMHKTLMGNN